jgi:hypothetical protein
VKGLEPSGAAPGFAGQPRFNDHRGFVLVRRMYTREQGELQSLLRRPGVIMCAKLYQSEVRAMGPRRVFFAVLFLALSVSAVNAYTVVMRDGRRIEISNDFTVTNSTLTYQVNNGFQITIHLNTVDIAATERANGEAQGSFLLKANAPKAIVKPAPQTGRVSARRSITNADLEKYRRTRVESEKEYEAKRQELGLPSMEERRREVAEIDERTAEHVRNMRAQEEAYWRSRAEALRAELAVKQAQGNGWRQQSAEPWAYPFGASAGFFDGVGFGVVGGGFNRFRPFPSSPFDGFLATPITRFPNLPFDQGFRRPVFGPRRGVPVNPRPNHMRRGSRR